MIEIECLRCHKKHYPKSLEKTLLCCSNKAGVTRLIVEIVDYIETSSRWFAVTKVAAVRSIMPDLTPEECERMRKDTIAKMTRSRKT